MRRTLLETPREVDLPKPAVSDVALLKIERITIKQTTNTLRAISGCDNAR